MMGTLSEPTIDTLLPLEPGHPASANTRGLRLFACACAQRVLELVTDPWIREAIDAGRQYALGNLDIEKLRFAFTMADAIKVPFHRRPSDYAKIAATACALTECYAGPMHSGTSPEWGALAAARVGSCAARQAEQGAWGRSPEEVERSQVALLRQYVPECFPEG